MKNWNPFRKEDPKELVRKWKTSIRSQIRGTEREMNHLVLEQKKAAVAIKDAAKRNDMVSAKMLAKEVVRLRGTVGRLAANKANLLSLSNQMTEMAAMAAAGSTIKSSTEVMSTMNGLIKVPQLQQNMKQMAKEMAKAGFIQEMMGDAMDMAMDSEDLEEEADVAVDQVLLEITGETLSQMSTVPTNQVATAAAAAATQEGVTAQQVEEDEDDLMERLAGLRA